jgi:hypothetical protein
MKKVYLVLIFSMFFSWGKSQIPFLPRLDNADIFKESGIIAGYTFNFGFDSGLGGNHMVELGWKRAWFVRFIQTASANYYFASDFNLDLNNFIIGPKIGGYLGFSAFVAGGDLVFYTNFGQGTLRFLPYAGFGNHAFRLVFSPHIPIVNSDLPGLNDYNVTLSIRMVRLSRERILRERIRNRE